MKNNKRKENKTIDLEKLKKEQNIAEIKKKLSEQLQKMDGKKLKMYSVLDKMMGFNEVFICQNDAIAVRNFAAAAYNNPTIAQNPKLFELWFIGEMDSKTADVVGNKHKIVNAEEARLTLQ